MTPAKLIKSIRARTNLSQSKFAAKFHIPRRTVEAWEAGKRTPPEYLVYCLAAAVVSEELGIDLLDYFPELYEKGG